jgi:F-type H+-transporting ATPase subunit delta
MPITAVSRRYAKSLLGLATQQNVVDAVDADMRIIAETIRANNELEAVLGSAVIRGGRKEAVLKALFPDAHKLSLDFLSQLTSKGRGALVLDAAVALIDAVRTARGIVTAKLTTAVPLDEKRLEEIMSLISEIHPKGVELTQLVDPEQIGGFKLLVGDRMVDTSVRSSLQSMHRDFTNHPYEPGR